MRRALRVEGTRGSDAFRQRRRDQGRAIGLMQRAQRRIPDAHEGPAWLQPPRLPRRGMDPAAGPAAVQMVSRGCGGVVSITVLFQCLRAECWWFHSTTTRDYTLRSFEFLPLSLSVQSAWPTNASFVVSSVSHQRRCLSHQPNGHDPEVAETAPLPA